MFYLSYKLLWLAQFVFGILAVILLLGWLLNRNSSNFMVGLFLLLGVFFSIDYCQWWPLLAAMVASFLVKTTAPA